MEISAAADTQNEAAAQVEHLSARSARSESHQPQCFADTTNTMPAQPEVTCHNPSRLGKASALQLSSGSTVVHTAKSTAAATKEGPTDGGRGGSGGSQLRSWTTPSREHYSLLCSEHFGGVVKSSRICM